LREIIDYYKDESGATRINDVLGTYTSLPAAKAAALTAIKDSGYERDDFEVYEEKSRIVENWTHGNGVLVYAKAPSGTEFYVRIDTNRTPANLKETPKVVSTPSCIHYVLQIKIDYNNDRIGGIQTTEVESTYLHQQEARDTALKALIGEGGVV
jgi:hypothetical protein